jgi:long-chain acyl-CoA synthetase
MYYSALWYGFDLVVTDPGHLFRALKELHPTILIAPPLFYEAIESKFYALPAWKRLAAQSAGILISLARPKHLRSKLARVVFREVYQLLGGMMRFMVTGMAPIKRSTLELMSRMQLPVYETYGLTEFGSISLNLPGACKLRSVGRPLPGVEIEIASDGEIIAHREHSIAQGYFVIGRKKEMIVTAGGEKIHPETIESEIDACPDVARSVVFQDERMPFLAAVILPRNPEDSEARARIQVKIDELNRGRSNTSVGRLIFATQGFSRDNGFLRPNLKLDRRRIACHFQSCVRETTI